MHTLSSHIRPQRIPLNGTSTYVGAAGQTTLTSEGIDTRDFESCLVRVAFGAIVGGAATSIKLQQSDDDGSTDGYSDIAGTAQTVADTDDNKIFQIDVHKPGKRWLTLIVLRATQDSTVDFIEAIAYNPLNAAPAAHATVGGTETFNTPAEGTA